MTRQTLRELARQAVEGCPIGAVCPQDVAPRLATPCRDIAAWRCKPGRYVLWTHRADGTPFDRLPRELTERLSGHEGRLRRRADYRSGPPWQLFRTGLASAPHRVIWPDLGRRLSAAVPAPDGVPLNTVYGIATRDSARGGFRRFNARVVRGLPVPAAGSAVWAELARRGHRCESADDLIADAFELDGADR